MKKRLAFNLVTLAVIVLMIFAFIAGPLCQTGPPAVNTVALPLLGLVAVAAIPIGASIAKTQTRRQHQRKAVSTDQSTFVFNWPKLKSGFTLRAGVKYLAQTLGYSTGAPRKALLISSTDIINNSVFDGVTADNCVRAGKIVTTKRLSGYMCAPRKFITTALFHFAQFTVDAAGSASVFTVG